MVLLICAGIRWHYSGVDIHNVCQLMCECVTVKYVATAFRGHVCRKFRIWNSDAGTPIPAPISKIMYGYATACIGCSIDF